MKKIQVKDLPEKVFDEIFGAIWPYSIGLVAVTECSSGEDALLMGSGTLIRVGDTKGILTAYHVVSSDRYRKARYLGLDFLSHIHRFIADKEYVKIVEVAKPREPSIGPDLAVIILPDVKIPWVEATKRFWDISLRRHDVLPNPVDRDIGLWCLVGFPDEFTRMEDPRPGFNNVKGFCNMFGWSGVQREWFDGEYDYLDISVLYEDDIALPVSFGGVSGGGIWQIPLLESGDGVIESKEPIFSGVAFYETAIEDKKRCIRGHGRSSVYETVYKKLKDNTV